MDALALLCNLYGDGPATLKRLRSAGCDTFGALEDLEPDQLAPILGTNEAAARRFLREARLLVERLTEAGPELEERPPLSARPAAPAPPVFASATPAGVPASAAESGGARDPRHDGGGEDAVDRRSSEVIDRVLATWRERDRIQEAPRRASSAGHADEPGEPLAGTAAPRAAARPRGTALAPRRVDGLDRTLCEALTKAGFQTLEELADADPLVASRSAGLELTRVMRLQFLARRQLAEAGPGAEGVRDFALAPPSGSGAGVRTARVARAIDPSTGSQAQGGGPGRPDVVREAGDGVLRPPSRPWPLARGAAAPRTGPSPSRATATGKAPVPPRSPYLDSPRPGAERPARPSDVDGPAPALPKFSISEIPFGAATSHLADELDRAGRRLRRGASEPPGEGTGGPFA